MFGRHARQRSFEDAMIPGPMRLNLIIIILALIGFALAMRFL